MIGIARLDTHVAEVNVGALHIEVARWTPYLVKFIRPLRDRTICVDGRCETHVAEGSVC